MNRLLRQTALGFGTFGTGCALLALSVNPYLLVLTDAVVGAGMLFAAGSISMNDLPLKKQGEPGKGAAGGTETVPEGADEIPAGLKASLGKLKGSLKPPSMGKGKEEKEARTKEIDQMLDATLAGQSKRLISLADGQGAAGVQAAKAAPAAAAAPGHAEDLLHEFSKAEIGAPFGDEEESGGEAPATGQAQPVEPDHGPATAMIQEALPATQGMASGIPEETKADVSSLTGESLGADDLLSALRREAMKEKKKDDTSLVRDLRGVKVTGNQLLEELDSLVRDIRRR